MVNENNYVKFSKQIKMVIESVLTKAEKDNKIKIVRFSETEFRFSTAGLEVICPPDPEKKSKYWSTGHKILYNIIIRKTKGEKLPHTICFTAMLSSLSSEDGAGAESTGAKIFNARGIKKTVGSNNSVLNEKLKINLGEDFDCEGFYGELRRSTKDFIDVKIPEFENELRVELPCVGTQPSAPVEQKNETPQDTLKDVNFRKVKALAVYNLLSSVGGIENALSAEEIAQKLSGIGYESYSLREDVNQINKYFYLLNNSSLSGFNEDGSNNVILKIAGRHNKFKYYFNENFQHARSSCGCGGLSASEVNFLCDVVLSVSCLSSDEKQSLCKKIKSLENNADCKLSDDAQSNNDITAAGGVLNYAEVIRNVIDYNQKEGEKGGNHKAIKFNAFSVDYKSEKTNTDMIVAVPVSLEYKNGVYYLCCVPLDSEALINYRLDCITDVMEYDTLVSEPIYEKEDKKTNLLLTFKESAIKRITDRFADKAQIEHSEGEWYTLFVKTEITDDLFDWLESLETDVKVLSPMSVIAEFKERLNRIIALYPGSNDM